MEKIQETCGRIKRISITGNPDAISRLLVSYGDQLDWAYFRRFKENHIKHVARACRNARFEADIINSGVILPALNLLDHQLENLSADLREENGDMSELAAAWDTY